MRPSVSVIVPTFDAAWCVERALDSVMAQTAPASEVIVCDDGSSDGTPELVERRYGMRVRVLRLPHRNAAAARADGLAAARGDWLALLDADDWWESDKLEGQLDFAAAHPDVRWQCADGVLESAEGTLRTSWLSDYFAPVTDRAGDLFEPLAQRCFPLTSSVLVRRDAFADVGGMDPTIVHSHDYDLWLRLAARFAGGVMARPLVHYWSHPGQLSRRLAGRHRDDLAIMRRVAAGVLRPDAESRTLGRARVAELAFDVGLDDLREGRAPEARARFREALAGGSARRRAYALAGSLLPAFALPALRGMRWLKSGVADAREAERPTLTAGGGA